MNDINPYRSTSNTKPQRKESPEATPNFAAKKLPFAIFAIAVMDILLGLIFGYFFLYNMFITIFDDWVPVVFAGFLMLIATLFFATAIALLSQQPVGRWLGIFSHAILAIFVLLMYAAALYLLIVTWGDSNRYYKGGDPISLAIVTAIFLAVQFLASLPIFVLSRRESRRLFT